MFMRLCFQSNSYCKLIANYRLIYDECKSMISHLPQDDLCMKIRFYAWWCYMLFSVWNYSTYLFSLVCCTNFIKTLHFINAITEFVSYSYYCAVQRFVPSDRHIHILNQFFCDHYGPKNTVYYLRISRYSKLLVIQF